MNQQVAIDPTALELDDIYRGMPMHGSLFVSARDAATIMGQMEQVGFVGMEVISPPEEKVKGTIRAYKGKHGPCLFNGWIATYLGYALAVLDDDLHLFFRNIPTEVCDKTKEVLSLPPYQGLIKCSLNDKKNRKDDSKVESPDFEQGMGMLYDKLKNILPDETDRIALYYPGPFRVLILNDGTLVKRGMTCSVPKKEATSLMKHERFELVNNQISLPKPVLFHEKYAAEGSMFINNDYKVTSAPTVNPAPDFSQLRSIGKSLRERLLDTIEKQRKYFVLVGSDISERGGCCPSLEVTEANLLARHGILSAHRDQATGDACPVTVYSFRDELTITDGGIVSKINLSFRTLAREHLYAKPTLTWKKATHMILLVFVVISLLLAIKKCGETRVDMADDQEVLSLLNPQKTDMIQLILFHNEKRCFQCLEMERLASEVVNESFGEMSENSKIVFTTIAMDNPKFTTLTSRYGLFSTTMVLVRFHGDMIISEMPLFKTSSLYRDENAFKARLQADLQHFLDTAHD